MSTTLVETIEAPAQTRDFAEELQASMAAVRLSLKWFGVRKSVTVLQRREAAETFDAATNFVSMGKKLIDTDHPAWKTLIAVRGKIVAAWKEASLPFPEQGIRLIKRSDASRFAYKIETLRTELREAERGLDRHYDELRVAAQGRLGSLYNADDYPASMIGLFDATIDYPSVEPPEYLRTFSPSLYRQEAERVKSRFDEAVKLAEDAFFGELTKLVEHIVERFSGSVDGKPKIFRDSILLNLMDFFDRFRLLNIGSSEELDRLVAEVRRAVSGATTSDLRNSATLRQRISSELVGVQARLDGLMVDRPRRNLIRRNGGTNANRV